MSGALQLAFLQMLHMAMGAYPGMEARELGLTLVCLYCLERFQAGTSCSVSVSLNEQCGVWHSVN